MTFSGLLNIQTNEATTLILTPKPDLFRWAFVVETPSLLTASHMSNRNTSGANLVAPSHQLWAVQCLQCDGRPQVNDALWDTHGDNSRESWEDKYGMFASGLRRYVESHRGAEPANASYITNIMAFNA